MESFEQMHIRLDKMTQPGWGDAADNICQGDIKYGIAKLMVAADDKFQTDMTATRPLLRTFGELKQSLDILPRQSQMPQGNSRLGCSHMRLDSKRPRQQKLVASPSTDMVPNSSPNKNPKSIEPESF